METEGGIQEIRVVAQNPAAVAIVSFVDWLYEHGPNPDEVTREKLVLMYAQWQNDRGIVIKFPTKEEPSGPRPFNPGA